MTDEKILFWKNWMKKGNRILYQNLIYSPIKTDVIKHNGIYYKAFSNTLRCVNPPQIAAHYTVVQELKRKFKDEDFMI